jgi:hypothetical protein
MSPPQLSGHRNGFARQPLYLGGELTEQYGNGFRHKMVSCFRSQMRIHRRT